MDGELRGLLHSHESVPQLTDCIRYVDNGGSVGYALGSPAGTAWTPSDLAASEKTDEDSRNPPPPMM
jgi:hypothetical protein